VSPRLHEEADIKSDRLEVEHKLSLKCTGGWLAGPPFPPGWQRDSSAVVDLT
jgi:hypothetical protein